ncbi:cystinosin homolog [Phtheirospermum japonicum]|uniref:Cystinosin homolog n=1 Tax=Phtheirospermum japonicum TaxID=374723 RepID=A0A830BSG9_9LAMI|nr:cystinosin homolog [Phtheirospermum japonicum]
MASSSWDSVYLKVLYNVFGWIAFISWSICFYPQIILNYRRKSVVGFNFDYALLNMVKQLAYLIYNVSIFFSPIVQKQYRQKFGNGKMLPVAESDLAFSIHVVLASAYTMYQIAIYDRGTQKFSKIYTSIVVLFVLAAAVCVCIAIPRHSWFWLVSCFNTIQVVMTVLKYIPQVVFNFQRKSTSGFSIGNVLLDFLGAVANNVQMLMQSLDQKSWENFYGNLGKSLLATVTIVFDIIFIVQHYALYPTKKAEPDPSVVRWSLQL